MNVRRTIKINAPAQKVLDTLVDFKTWPKWSPWLIAEPNAKVDVATDGQSYTWQGTRVGSGQMSIKSTNDHSVDYDLQFLKPYKSQADTGFVLNEQGDHTEVAWTMNSKLPFFMFFMKKKMEAFIGNDYERGLAMLKNYVEDGTVDSQLEFVGIQPFNGIKYVGIKRDTTIEGMKKHMGGDFGALMGQLKAGNGTWFSIYHKFDFVKEAVSYTACVGVDEYPADLDPSWVKGEIPEGKVHTVRHVGPYDHIGNAWATSMMMMRNKEFKPNKKFHPMEFYLNSPENTPPKELVSEIRFMVK